MNSTVEITDKVEAHLDALPADLRARRLNVLLADALEVTCNHLATLDKIFAKAAGRDASTVKDVTAIPRALVAYARQMGDQ